MCILKISLKIVVTLTFDKYDLPTVDLHAVCREHIYGTEGATKVFPNFPGVSRPPGPSSRDVYS